MLVSLIASTVQQRTRRRIHNCNTIRDASAVACRYATFSLLATSRHSHQSQIPTARTLGSPRLFADVRWLCLSRLIYCTILDGAGKEWQAVYTTLATCLKQILQLLTAAMPSKQRQPRPPSEGLVSTGFGRLQARHPVPPQGEGNTDLPSRDVVDRQLHLRECLRRMWGPSGDTSVLGQ
jgi:hypothetical protein